jgi:zinc-binding alcohol dehydrogenase/oxidoreductase
MKKMQAVVLQEAKNFDSLRLKEVPLPAPGPAEALVKLEASALNHRDVWIVQGLYSKIKLPIILGSDGAGVVEAVGEGVDNKWVGKAVLINPALGWGNNQEAQGPAFRILGMPDDGTQAQYVRVPAADLTEKPDYLTFEEAAALPLGALTGYRALFNKGMLQKGETVLLTGIGGGVAALMLVMAVAAGARVLVTSGSRDKIDRAVKAGASGGALYSGKEWAKDIAGLAGDRPIDLVVDSAGGDEFPELLEVVKPGGRIVNFGATAGNPKEVNLRRIFWKQLTIQGTTMGSPTDFYNMIKFFTAKKIKPLIDSVNPLQDFRLSYQKMINGEQCGKLVLKHT